MKATSTIAGAEGVVVRLQAASPALRGRLEKAVERVTITLSGYVKAEKLTGQVLKNRTGRLRRSINHSVTSSGQAIVGTVGTNVSYARVHEFGFTGAQSVRAHVRTIKQAWGKPIAATQINVKTHARTVKIPARSFLRSALNDQRTSIKAALAAAVKG